MVMMTMMIKAATDLNKTGGGGGGGKGARVTGARPTEPPEPKKKKAALPKLQLLAFDNCFADKMRTLWPFFARELPSLTVALPLVFPSFRGSWQCGTATGLIESHL